MRPMGLRRGSSPRGSSSEIAAVTFDWKRSSFVSPLGHEHKEVAMKQSNTSIKFSVRITSGLISLAKGVVAAIQGVDQGNGSSSST